MLNSLFITTGQNAEHAPQAVLPSHLLQEEVQGLAGEGGLGWAKFHNGWMLAAAGVLALIGPTSQAIAFGHWLRPRIWMAVPLGLAGAGLVLMAGGRLQNAFIYFQF